MLYCLDTSIVIDIFYGDRSLLSKLEALKNQNVVFCIASISLAELYKGAYLAQKQKEALKLVEEFSQNIEFLDLTKDACKLFGQKYLELKKQGKQTQEADLMIGCIALANNATFATRNLKDFSNIKGLKVMQW